MFGHGWTTGSAKVLRRRVLSVGKDGYKNFEYLLEVSPDGGLASFQTTLTDPRWGLAWRRPQAHDVVKVHCDPVKHEAKWDRSDPKLHQDPSRTGTIGPGGAPDWF